MADNWEAMAENSRRETETFRRIHQLYKRGFRPDWSVTDVEDAIWWKHPGNYPPLILFPAGDLVASMGRAVLDPHNPKNKHCIGNDRAGDAMMFDRWLSSVSRPTWWQEGVFARERYVMFPLVVVAGWGLMSLLSFAAIYLLRALWRSIFG